MKKLNVLFSIFAVLMAVTFTSCEDPAKTMEPFTEDMIGEWMIGTWDYNRWGYLEPVIFIVKGIEDDSEVLYFIGFEGEEIKKFGTFKDFKKELFIETKDTDEDEVCVMVNKERSEISITITRKWANESGCKPSIWHTFRKHIIEN